MRTKAEKSPSAPAPKAMSVERAGVSIERKPRSARQTARVSTNVAKFAQDRDEPHLLAEIDAARHAAGLEGEAVRPFAGDEAHDLEQTRARRQDLAQPPRRGSP